MTTNEKQFAFSVSLGRLLAFAGTKGYSISLRDVYRSREEQERLYAIGRTTELDKKPVTWTLKSLHSKSIAADILVFENGQPVWDGDHVIYQELGRVWAELGGEWGGTWQGKKRDSPHFQWKEGM